jgi:hypothetical protein
MTKKQQTNNVSDSASKVKKTGKKPNSFLSSLIKPLFLTILFSIIYLFFWEKYEENFIFLSALANNMLASKTLLTLAKQVNSEISTKSWNQSVWKWFSIVRTYLVIQIIWHFVSQLIKQRIKYEITDFRKLEAEFLFGERMTIEIWLEFAFCQAWELIPVNAMLNPLILNFSFFVKIANALASLKSFNSGFYKLKMVALKKRSAKNVRTLDTVLR